MGLHRSLALGANHTNHNSNCHSSCHGICHAANIVCYGKFSLIPIFYFNLESVRSQTVMGISERSGLIPLLNDSPQKHTFLQVLSFLELMLFQRQKYASHHVFFWRYGVSSIAIFKNFNVMKFSILQKSR